MLEIKGKNEQGETISMASGVFANGKSGSTHFTGASYHEYMRYCPNEPLIWEAIKILHERGAGSLIFGGTGHYKKKYGSIYAYIPVMAFSRFKILLGIYKYAKKVYGALADLWGRIRN